MKIFIFAVIAGSSLVYGNPFSMEVKVSKPDTLNQIRGVEAQCEQMPAVVEKVPVVPVTPIVQPGGFQPVVGGLEPVKPVVLSMPMALDVGGEEKSFGTVIVYKSPDRKPLLKGIENSDKGESPVFPKEEESKKKSVNGLEEGVLPPLKEEGILPKVTSSPISEVVQSPLLMSRDGMVLSGEGDMLDYMVSKALPARPVSGKFEDNFLNSLGAPGSISRAGNESPRSVTMEPVGSMAPGVAFGVPYLGGKGESAISGFEPLPPSGYRGRENDGVDLEQTIPLMSGQVW